MFYWINWDNLKKLNHQNVKCVEENAGWVPNRLTGRGCVNVYPTKKKMCVEEIKL